MRSVIILAAALAAALLVASNAGAEPVMLWHGFALDPVPDTTPNGERPDWQDLRIGTSENAFIVHPGSEGRSEWRASDGSHVAALFADLTDGDNDPITWSSTNFAFTMDENRFLQALVPDPPLVGHYSYPELFADNIIDLAGFHIDHIEVQLGRDGAAGVRYKRYGAIVFGAAPEPASAALLMLGLCCCHGFRVVGRRRSTGC